MDAPTITFLIPTIPGRQDDFLRLLDRLLPQLDEHEGRARVLAWRNTGEPRLAELRDRLLADAGSEYVAFIDDDDMVSEDYVDSIMAALIERPDHVGFQVAYCVDGEFREVVEHSLTWKRWHRSGSQLVRDFTHVDPIRRDLAQRGRFAQAPAGRAEDRVWVKQVRPFLHTEVYVPRVLYTYLWSDKTTAWQRPERAAGNGSERPTILHQWFDWHPDSDA
jgi:hypothetical protein